MQARSVRTMDTGTTKTTLNFMGALPRHPPAYKILGARVSKKARKLGTRERETNYTEISRNQRCMTESVR